MNEIPVNEAAAAESAKADDPAQQGVLPRKVRRISIGMLAWNEQDNIASTINYLVAQTLFHHPPDVVTAIEIVCVPNGCTDQTAQVAEEALAAALNGCPVDFVDGRVVEIAEAGKANAWNRFVHEFSDPDADALILLDADAIFTEPRTLGLLVESLSDRADVLVTTAKMMKDIELKPHASWSDRLSLLASSLHQRTPALISGMLYCARANALRRIRMPTGLLVEDGFLRAMILTDGFRRAEDLSVVKQVAGASVVFKAYCRIFELFHHEKRLILGSEVNAKLFPLLASLPQEVDRADWIHQRNCQHPGWVSQLVAQSAEHQGWWRLGRGAVFRRFSRLRHVPWPRRAVWLPLACVISLIELPIMLAANAQLRRGWERAW